MDNEVDFSRYWKLLSALLFGLTFACSEPAEEIPANTETTADQEYPELLHAEPTGEGMELAPSLTKSLSSAPQISVGAGWSDRDREDMVSLVDRSVELMTNPRFSAMAATLNDQYPKVWFAKALGFGDAAMVGSYVQRPPAPSRYLPATVVPSNGWAETGGSEGNVQISVSPALLNRYRSRDVVMRACAINTMAHEISHTISRSPTRYYYAFTDTGVGREARRTPPASYLTGDIALCLHLIDEGRIGEEDLRQCVSVWYRPKGFQSKRCDDFPGDTPIR
tara:strand:- start:139 stop:975 length:837 start_codon:yes stop_codon:yes gene_type:complete